MSDEFSIQDLIQHFLNQNDKTHLFHERNVIQLWNDEMGPFILQNTKNVEMKNGVLYVKLLNASLRFELSGRRSEIIKKLNEKAGVEVIKDILFV